MKGLLTGSEWALVELDEEMSGRDAVRNACVRNGVSLATGTTRAGWWIADEPTKAVGRALARAADDDGGDRGSGSCAALLVLGVLGFWLTLGCLLVLILAWVF